MIVGFINSCGEQVEERALALPFLLHTHPQIPLKILILRSRSFWLCLLSYDHLFCDQMFAIDIRPRVELQAASRTKSESSAYRPRRKRSSRRSGCRRGARRRRPARAPACARGPPTAVRSRSRPLHDHSRLWTGSAPGAGVHRLSRPSGSCPRPAEQSTARPGRSLVIVVAVLVLRQGAACSGFRPRRMYCSSKETTHKRFLAELLD